MGINGRAQSLQEVKSEAEVDVKVWQAHFQVRWLQVGFNLVEKAVLTHLPCNFAFGLTAFLES